MSNFGQLGRSLAPSTARPCCCRKKVECPASKIKGLSAEGVERMTLDLWPVDTGLRGLRKNGYVGGSPPQIGYAGPIRSRIGMCGGIPRTSVTPARASAFLPYRIAQERDSTGGQPSTTHNTGASAYK